MFFVKPTQAQDVRLFCLQDDLFGNSRKDFSKYKKAGLQNKLSETMLFSEEWVCVADLALLTSQQ